jgi:hypothetical protein
MDDFVLTNLYQAKDEWSARLVSLLTPYIAEGIHSIFKESLRMCVESKESAKYLINFQHLLARIPAWNSVIVEEEVARIVSASGCNYIEDLITCVHIIQLKVLTSIRVGACKKKIDINIPKLDVFIHKTYITAARKLFQQVFLFEKTDSMIQVQKNNRDIEIIVQESILQAIRDSIPTETIIRAYLEDSVEHDEEVIVEDVLTDEEPDIQVPSALEPDATPLHFNPKIEEHFSENEYTGTPLLPDIQPETTVASIPRITFNDYDSVQHISGHVQEISAPKTIDRLEQISTDRAIQKKAEEEEEDDRDKITILSGGEESVELEFDTL